MTIRWKKDDPMTGLASIGQVRGDRLRDTGTDTLLLWTGRLPYSMGDTGPNPWSWYLRLGNRTLQSKTHFASSEEAKVAADAYYKSHKEKILRANGLNV